MEHSYYRDKLSAFHDGQLTEEEQRMLQEHIDSCPECRAEIEELKKLDALIDRHADLGDGDYWEKSALEIEEKLGFETPAKVTDVRRNWKGLGWKIAAVAASVAVLTFIGLHRDELYQPSTPEAEAPAEVKAPFMTSMVEEYGGASDSLPAASPTEESPVMEMEDGTAAVSPDAAGEPRRDRIVEETVEHKAAEAEPTKPAAPDVVGLADAVDLEEAEEVPAKREEIAAPQVAAPAPVQEMSRAKVAKLKSAADSSLRVGAEAISFDAAPLTQALQKPAGQTALDMSFMDIAQDKDEAAGTELSLADWRQIRDSLTGDIPWFIDPTVIKWAAPPPVKKDRSNLAATDTDPDTERKLVEAHYKIASLTEDEAERDRSASWLQGYRDSDKASFKKLADKYLTEIEDLPKLDSDQN